jgi:SAM-dependent methyltransferase
MKTDFRPRREIWAEKLTLRQREVARLFKKRLGSTRYLLDIGGGDGVAAKYHQGILAAEQAYVVDNNPVFLEQAEKLGVKTVLLDVEERELPFEDEYFGAVFCGELIEHLRNTDHLLEQIRRILAPGGCLVMTTPNLASWYNRLTIIVGWQPFGTDVSTKYTPGRPAFLHHPLYPACGHISNFTYRALKELLILHGFIRVEHVWKPQANLWEAMKSPTPRKGTQKFIQRTFHVANQIFCYVPGMSESLILACSKGE